MDFTVIGTLHSYVQQNNFKFAADYKKKTGQNIIGSSGNLKLDLKAAENHSLVDKMIQAQQANKDEYSKQRVMDLCGENKDLCPELETVIASFASIKSDSSIDFELNADDIRQHLLTLPGKKITIVDKDGHHFGKDKLRMQQTPKKTAKAIEHFAYLMT